MGEGRTDAGRMRKSRNGVSVETKSRAWDKRGGRVGAGDSRQAGSDDNPSSSCARPTLCNNGAPALSCWRSSVQCYSNTTAEIWQPWRRQAHGTPSKFELGQALRALYIPM